jgi:hypothetical protein
VRVSEPTLGVRRAEPETSTRPAREPVVAEQAFRDHLEQECRRRAVSSAGQAAAPPPPPVAEQPAADARQAVEGEAPAPVEARIQAVAVAIELLADTQPIAMPDPAPIAPLSAADTLGPAGPAITPMPFTSARGGREDSVRPGAPIELKASEAPPADAPAPAPSPPSEPTLGVRRAEPETSTRPAREPVVAEQAFRDHLEQERRRRAVSSAGQAAAPPPPPVAERPAADARQAVEGEAPAPVEARIQAMAVAIELLADTQPIAMPDPAPVAPLSAADTLGPAGPAITPMPFTSARGGREDSVRPGAPIELKASEAPPADAPAPAPPSPAYAAVTMAVHDTITATASVAATAAAPTPTPTPAAAPASAATPAPVPAGAVPAAPELAIAHARLTPGRAEIALGEGAERVALRITADTRRVRVEAVAAPAAARALSAGSDDLREALRRHGLELELDVGSDPRSGAGEQHGSRRDDARGPAPADHPGPRPAARRPGVRSIA